MREGTIKIVWQTLFPVKTFSAGEYAEITYDDGDKQFKYALHVQTLEELLSFVEEYDGQVNMAISPNTRKPKRIERRTGREAVKRQKAILLDIEDPEKHKLRSPQEIKELIVEVLKNLPESLRKAIAFVGYTGGGGQICITLSRWIEGGEIDIVYEWLKKKLKDIKYIDPSSLNYGQAQRLLGTINVKYGVRTTILKANPNPVPLDVERILKEWSAEQEIELRLADQIEENRKRVTNLKEAIREIKRKIRFADLGYDGEGNGEYSKVLCPFHTEENPSFVIYHNENGDLAIDFHSDEYYDVIGFYQKLYGKDFITAVRELAEKAGVKLALSREERKRLQKERALEDFDPHSYISEELRIERAELYKMDGEFHLDIYVRDMDERETLVSGVSLFKFLNRKWGMKYIWAHTGVRPGQLPAGAEEEAWETVVDVLLREVAEKNEEDLERSAVSWEVDELRRIIYEGAMTEDIDDFLAPKSRYLKFYDENTGEVYVLLRTLIRELKLSLTFERITVQKVISLLRRLGAVPDRIQRRNKRVRVWKLPNTDDWRVDRAVHLLDESSGQLENIEAVREEQNVTTTDTTFSHPEKGRAEEKRTEKKWAGGAEIKKSVETQEPESAHFPEKRSGQGGQEGGKKTKQSLERQGREEVSAFPEETDTSQERSGQSGHQEGITDDDLDYLSEFF